MRCYDGCPDTELQKLLDSKQAARDRLKAAFPNASCTYFPMEEKFLVFMNYKQVGEFESDVITCCDKAIEILKANE